MDDFIDFNPKKGSIITCELDFISEIFRITCDDKKVASKNIKKNWKLRPFLMTCFDQNEMKIQLQFPHELKEVAKIGYAY